MGNKEWRDPTTGRIHRGYTIETLEDHARDQRHEAWCNDCGHHVAVDLGQWIGSIRILA